MEKLRFEHDALQSQGLWRELREAAGIDFASNDYLGFSNHAELRQTLITALQQGCALGSTGSRLLRGETDEHRRTETICARLHGAEAALLFGSGYAANIGVLSALADEDTIVFSDELNHASLVDGIRLSRAGRWIYPHLCLDRLEQLLKQEQERERDQRKAQPPSRKQRRLIATESVFSMDGDLAPLENLVDLARAYDAWLVIDETHGTGVFGPSGLGRTETLATKDVGVVTIHSGAKALGGSGAYVTCPQRIRDHLVQRARTFMFSTALPPLTAIQIRAALAFAQKESELRHRLFHNVRFFLNALESRSVPLIGSSANYREQVELAPIVPLLLGSNEKVIEAAARLQALGFDVRGIRSPAVPRGTERLRISIKAFHREQELIGLANAIQGVLS